MSLRLTYSPEQSSLMVLGVVSIGVAYISIMQKNLQICAQDWCSAGRKRPMRKSMEHEEDFF